MSKLKKNPFVLNLKMAFKLYKDVEYLNLFQYNAKTESAILLK